MRKPVGAGSDNDSAPLVVCDDGSVWRYIFEYDKWEEMASIPGSARWADEQAVADE